MHWSTGVGGKLARDATGRSSRWPLGGVRFECGPLRHQSSCVLPDRVALWRASPSAGHAYRAGGGGTFRVARTVAFNGQTAFPDSFLALVCYLLYLVWQHHSISGHCARVHGTYLFPR